MVLLVAPNVMTTKALMPILLEKVYFSHSAAGRLSVASVNASLGQRGSLTMRSADTINYKGQPGNKRAHPRPESSSSTLTVPWLAQRRKAAMSPGSDAQKHGMKVCTNAINKLLRQTTVDRSLMHAY